MNKQNTHTAANGLSVKLHFELWRLVERRLSEGEVLVTNEQFVAVMESDFKGLIGEQVEFSVRDQLMDIVARVNAEHPDTYLALGIQNALKRFIGVIDSKRGTKSGRQVLQQMIEEKGTHFLLLKVGVSTQDLQLIPTLETTLKKIIQGESLEAFTPPENIVRFFDKTQEMQLVGPGKQQVVDKDADTQDTVSPEAKEHQLLVKAMEIEKQELTKTEWACVPKHLSTYVDEDIISTAEADCLRSFFAIDEQLKRGDINQAEAENLGLAIDQEMREVAAKKLQQAVDYRVCYIHVFEDLKRLVPQRDEALKFIIRYKQLVMSDTRDIDWSVVLRALEQDQALFDELHNLMVGKDRPVRMLAANLPPYRHIKSALDKVTQLSIEADFIDDLRLLDVDMFSARMNSEDKDTRIKTAVDIQCLLRILLQLVSESPIHAELRRFKIRQTLIRLYQEGEDHKANRSKVQKFIMRQLHRLYPQLSASEKNEITSESQTIMSAIDKGEEPKMRGEKKGGRVYRT